MTNSSEGNLLSLCDVSCSKKQISSTQKTQSFIVSSARAFDVSLTKAPAPKAPFTGFFSFLNAPSVLLGCETLTFWVCLLFQSEAGLGLICSSLLSSDTENIQLLIWWTSLQLWVQFSLFNSPAGSYTSAQFLPIKLWITSVKRALFMTTHLLLSPLSTFFAEFCHRGSVFMLIHKFLSTSVIYWGVYLIHEVAGKTLSTAPSRLLE